MIDDKAWSPKDPTTAQWLQVSLPKLMKITCKIFASCIECSSVRFLSFFNRQHTAPTFKTISGPVLIKKAFHDFLLLFLFNVLNHDLFVC